jgi:RNA polymerase sigma factor (sigma-70 family)
MNTGEFEERLKALRPRLHRYCARMTGSAVNGEDVLQDTLVKALHARAQGAAVDNLEGWLFRIAHNASLDFLRDRSRNTVVPLTEDLEAAPIPEADLVAISFQTFLRLPELQRCAGSSRMFWVIRSTRSQASPNARWQPPNRHCSAGARRCGDSRRRPKTPGCR